MKVLDNICYIMKGHSFYNTENRIHVPSTTANACKFELGLVTDMIKSLCLSCFSSPKTYVPSFSRVMCYTSPIVVV